MQCVYELRITIHTCGEGETEKSTDKARISSGEIVTHTRIIVLKQLHTGAVINYFNVLDGPILVFFF